MNNNLCHLCLLWMLILTPFSIQGQLKINEFMASNTHVQIRDDYSDFVDWIELYNAGDKPVDLFGIFFTDDFTHPYKWQYLENEVIAPGSYFIIWADGDNVGNHTSFKLSDNGEQIGIFRGDGMMIDTITFPAQAVDVSFGRFPDGGEDWHYYSDPTFNQSNKDPGLRQLIRASPPTFTPEGGRYQQGQMVSISGPEGTIYRYTLDGSVPDANSGVYQEPIRVDTTIVIRARGFHANALPGIATIKSYIINDPTDLPVISITTPPQYLFDEEVGITVGTCVSDELDVPPPFDPDANFWNDWERPVHIEYLMPDGSVGIDQDAGIKIFGGAFGRQIRQKAFTLFARKKYGDRDFDYPLFPKKSIDEFRRFILRCSSNDFNKTYIRDAMLNMLVAGQMDVDYQDYQPAMVYLNGAFWGLYNIREKTNQYYPESNYGISADDVDLVENIGEIAHGDGSGYLDLVQFVRSHDLSIHANYQYVSAQIDISEFMNYYITEIYVDNKDWLHRNTKCWRQHGTDGKWRWILYDLDWGFGGELASIKMPWVDPTLSWVIDQGEASVLFRGLLQNQGFREEFAQRFATHLNLSFNVERVHRIIDKMALDLSADMPRQIERWGAITSMDYWYEQLARLYQFAEERQFYVYQDLENTLQLDELTHIAIENPDTASGWISIHDVPVNLPFTEGSWFKDIPVRIKAHPNPGWQFVRWEGDFPSEQDQVFFVPTVPSVLMAIFEPIESPKLVLNEIHYNPSAVLQGDDELYEFIELLNWGDIQIDLSGWSFSDGIEFVFPEGSSIKPGELVILAVNKSTYEYLENQVFQITGGRLNNAGEGLCLVDSSGNVVDQVLYDDQLPWPVQADGQGPSMELIDPAGDNSIAGAWGASHQTGGSPGTLGTSGTGLQKKKDPEKIAFQVWPNPFSEFITLQISLARSTDCSIEIFNTMGRRIFQEVAFMNQGTHEIVWSPGEIPEGIYIVILRTKKSIFTEKILFSK